MRCVVLVCAAVVFGYCTLIEAAAYPSKPVRVVNPYTPGGAVDTVARAVARELSKTWRQPVIVDNRPGAGTTIGTEIVVRAVPDGYTLLLTSGTLAANVTLYRDLSFHPAKDLAPVAMLVQAPYIFAVQRPTPKWWAFVRGEMEKSAAYPKGRKRLVKLTGITAD